MDEREAILVSCEKWHTHFKSELETVQQSDTDIDLITIRLNTVSAHSWGESESQL